MNPKSVQVLLGFNIALTALKNGQRVTRRGWNGKGQFLELQTPDDNSRMTLPYIYITTVQGDRVPWLASQTDLLAGDWYTVKPEPEPRRTTILRDEHKDAVWKLDAHYEHMQNWRYEHSSARGWLLTKDVGKRQVPVREDGLCANYGFVEVLD